MNIRDLLTCYKHDILTMTAHDILTMTAFVGSVAYWLAATYWHFFSFPPSYFLASFLLTAGPMLLILGYIAHIGSKKAKERAERAEQEQERPYEPGPCLCFSCCNFQPKNTSHEQEKTHE